MRDDADFRRLFPRETLAVPAGIMLTKRSRDGDERQFMGKLIDVSDGGIGVETFVRMRKGALVDIGGILRQPGLALRVEGRARVAHCSPAGGGLYRLGLEFIQVACERAA